MANLVVTFTSAAPDKSHVQFLPVEVGSVADTEQIAIGVASVQGNKTATATRYIVSLFAEAACWVAIGDNPTAAAGSGRKMAADERLQLWVDAGEKVAVIQA